MTQNKIIKKSWFKLALMVIICIGAIIIISRLVIFSHPKPLQFYLEFLEKNSQRNSEISVYSREEFFQKYFNANPNESYQANDFLKLVREHFNYAAFKESSLFIVYKIPDPENPCQAYIYGINKKRDLVYVSLQNTCLKNNERNK